jgi:hypothetical protein
MREAKARTRTALGVLRKSRELSSMVLRARQERDDSLFAGMRRSWRRSMAYDQLPGAELRLARARNAGDEEKIARATRARSAGFARKSMPEADAAVSSVCGVRVGRAGACARDGAHVLIIISKPRIRR